MKIMKIQGSLALLFGLSFALSNAGCADRTDSPNASAMPNSGAIVVQNQTESVSPEADNSSKNQRDRDGATVTPGDQGNSAADRGLTQRIRKALVTDSNYSVTAKNIKIMTLDGRVTLRGPVNSDVERVRLVTLAQNIAGVDNVQDQLEVKANP
jgi:osmotically-inducible protein OsmY